MPVSRRQEILGMVYSENGKYIIEDDYDSEFRFSGKPIPTLQSMDTGERVIYINTFTKTLAPSMRISYMVLPPHLVTAYRKRLGFYACTVPVFEQITLSEFLKQGFFERHISRMRKLYRKTRALGAPVIGLTCCPGSAIDAAADIGIAPQPGPEVVTGSTRLKSGTAQKMVLNMLSTAVMVKLGKVYSNLMVDVCASNQKLVARAVSIVCCATGVSPERARGVLDEAGFSAKTAIVMILCGVDAGEAHALLQRVDGQVSAAVLSRPDGVQTDAFVRRL